MQDLGSAVFERQRPDRTVGQGTMEGLSSARPGDGTREEHGVIGFRSLQEKEARRVPL
jgi:hypothetical protein